MAESMERIFLNHTGRTGAAAAAAGALKGRSYVYEDQVFVIHCIGADRVECQTRDTISKAFSPIVQWIHQYNHFKDGFAADADADSSTPSIDNSSARFQWPKHLRIELLGPNVPMHSERFGNINLLPAIPGRLESATVFCKNCLYHDYLGELEDSSSSLQTQSPLVDEAAKMSTQFPNLVVVYNAGIWGYTDWHPTIRKLYEFKRPVPFVITAYTLQEAEEDAEVLEEVLDDDVGMLENEARCFWTAEINPYASRVVRETRSNHDNTYFENGAWQAYLMGKFASRSE